MAADLDPLNVDEVRRRVVMPVVQSLIRPDELEDILIEVSSVGSSNDPSLRILTVAVKACGEWIASPVGWGIGNGDPMNAEDYAGDLYDRLRDELSESRLSWGELRDGEYRVLPPERP